MTLTGKDRFLSSICIAMSHEDNQALVEDATLDYTLGDNESAIKKLNKAIQTDPHCFEAWHALSEVYFSLRNLDRALKAAEKAHSLRPADIHINTSLSRIWMERGDKATAEKFGAQARLLGWKKDLKEPESEEQT